MTAEEIAELDKLGGASSNAERHRDGAFHYEQARRLARERGDEGDAFRYGLRALQCWYYVENPERHLSMLLELSTEHQPHDVDLQDLYGLRVQAFYHSLRFGPLERAKAAQEDANAIYGLLIPEGPDFAFFEGCLLSVRGRHRAALEQFGIAWSRHSEGDHSSVRRSGVALEAARTSAHTGQTDETRAWIDRLRGNDKDTEISRRYCEILVAVHERDAGAALVALTAFDAAATGVQRSDAIAGSVEIGVAALTLNTGFGDPQLTSHPAAARLADVTSEMRRIPSRECAWHFAVLATRLAAVRYAAGLTPDEDYFDRPSLPIPCTPTPRLPHELGSRITACREAANDAAAAAQRVDKLFECDWRQAKVARLVERLDHISAAARAV